MARCDDCKANKVCDHNRFGFENCGNFIPADVVPKSEVDRLEKEVADLQDALKCEKETNKHLSDEYISAQKEISRLEKASLPSYYQACTEEEAIKIGKQYGRAEVAREIFEEIEENYADFLFDGCRNIIVITEKDYAELKKKYITEYEKGQNQSKEVKPRKPHEVEK